MPNTDVLAPLQQAIYTLLTSDATLMADVTGVFDYVPESTAFPYVTLGSSTATSQGALDRYGRRSTVTLHVWSAYHGWREAFGLVDHLLRLLDHQTLTVDGHEFVRCVHEQTVSMQDPDEDLRHVAVRFAIETEHPA